MKQTKQVKYLNTREPPAKVLISGMKTVSKMIQDKAGYKKMVTKTKPF